MKHYLSIYIQYVWIICTCQYNYMMIMMMFFYSQCMAYCKKISIFTALYVDKAVVRRFLWVFLLYKTCNTMLLVAMSTAALPGYGLNTSVVVGLMLPHCNYDVSYVYSLSLFNSLLLDFHLFFFQ